MLVIWLGAILVFGGVLFMAAQPIWRGRFSEARRTPSAAPGATLEPTLEPRKPTAGFGLKANAPGLILIVVGSMLLLVGAGL